MIITAGRYYTAEKMAAIVQEQGIGNVICSFYTTKEDASEAWRAMAVPANFMCFLANGGVGYCDTTDYKNMPIPIPTCSCSNCAFAMALYFKDDDNQWRASEHKEGGSPSSHSSLNTVRLQTKAYLVHTQKQSCDWDVAPVMLVTLAEARESEFLRVLQ